MPRFPGETDRVGEVELRYSRLKGALVALNAVFEAARVGSAGRLLSAGACEIENLLEVNGNATQDNSQGVS